MTTKEWLDRGYGIRDEIKALRRKRAEIKSKLSYLDGVRYDRIRVKKTPINGSEDMAIRYAAYEEELRRYEAFIGDKLLELAKVEMDIIEAVYKVQDTTLRKVLIYRYLDCMTWEEIGQALHYSDKWVRTRLHSRALNAIKKWCR